MTVTIITTTSPNKLFKVHDFKEVKVIESPTSCEVITDLTQLTWSDNLFYAFIGKEFVVLKGSEIEAVTSSASQDAFSF